MNRKRIAAITTGLVAVAAIGGYFFYTNTNSSAYAEAVATPTISQEHGKTVKTFELVAKEVDWNLDQENKVKAWTYNGLVPGSQIRVKQGDVVRVKLKNQLNDLVSIHWHGYPVPNSMDGIPGMTQNAVRPNETFTYEFDATVPGTYWYHSHQDSANQVDKGLYGTLVVEAKDEQPTARDYTLVLDEWMPAAGGAMNHDAMSMGGMDHSQMNMGQQESGAGSSMGGMDHSNMQGMDHSSMSGMDHGSMPMPSQPATAPAQPGTGQSVLPPGAMHDEMMKMMYTIFTVNGKSGSAIAPLEVERGDKVRLRFVNAGFQSHQISLQSQQYQIVSVDGQKIDHPQVITNQPLTIAPGERYDVEFTVDTDRSWLIESQDLVGAAKQMRVPVNIKGAEPAVEADSHPSAEKAVDLSAYGEKMNGKFSLDMKYDVEYNMDLGEKPGKTQMDAVFTINGKSYADVPPLKVKKGDKILVTMKNVGSSNHPMHLHGHFFQLLKKDDKPFTGAPIMKDTLNVKPGETYVVAFEADNPGDWMFHCHDLHHAAAGMVSEVKYEGYKSFVPDPSVGNKPE